MSEIASGSVMVDVLDAEDLVDMLLHATTVIDALAGDERAEVFNTQLAAGPRSLADLAIDLRLAAGDLDAQVRAHTGTDQD